MMNKESEKRLCRALAVWAEHEIAAMYDEVYIGHHSYCSVRKPDGEVERLKYVTLFGRNVKESEDDRYSPENIFRSPEEAARALVQSFAFRRLDLTDMQKVLILREPVEIISWGEYEPRISIRCRAYEWLYGGKSTFFEGLEDTPLTEWTAPSFWPCLILWACHP